MSRIGTCHLWIRTFVVIIGWAAASCGGGVPAEDIALFSPSSTNLTSGELASITTGMLGPMTTSLKSSATGSVPTKIAARGQGVSGWKPLDTFLIPYTPVTPNRVNCPAGGSYSQTGGMSGTVNTDSGLVKLSGTLIAVESDCAYTAGTLLNGDPYLSMLVDYTQTGDPWSLTVTISGGWAVTIAGRPRTNVLIDPGGIHVTMGSNAPNRIQGSLTAYPGGTSVSLNQTF